LNVGIFGSGVVGSAILQDCINNQRISKIFVYDKSKARINQLRNKFRTDKCEFKAMDFTKEETDISELDLIFGALPGVMGLKFMKWTIQKGVNVVDVSFTPEDPLQLDKLSKDASVTVIPDAGFAPGFTNLIVGDYYFNEFNRLNEVKIYVGALPEQPESPLMHTITWSVPDFVEEYTRPARIIQDGKVISVEPLSTIEKVEIKGLGRFEAFYSDGLRTLLHTVKVQSMAELTLRFKGHLQIMKILKALGLLSDEEIRVNSREVKPKSVLTKLLEKYKKDNIRDFIVMQIEAQGVINNTESTKSMLMIGKFDEENNISAIGISTGYSATAFGQLILEKRIREYGVIPPEIVAKEKENVTFIKNYLSKHKTIEIMEK